MRIDRFKLGGFLSYGRTPVGLDLRQLNVIVGTNGSGKSNLLDMVDLLRAAPMGLVDFVRKAGGVDEWVNNEVGREGKADIEVVVSAENARDRLGYAMSFASANGNFAICSEEVARLQSESPKGKPVPCFVTVGGRLRFVSGGKVRYVVDADYRFNESILSQRRDPIGYPEITWLANAFSSIRVYRDWQFGRHSSLRVPCKTDQPNAHLLEDGSNLALVLNHLQKHPQVKDRLVRELSRLYEGIDDYTVQIDGGVAQLFLIERGKLVSAMRLSDGTLRYLCILAVLLNPVSKGLVCIEEPEVGLHPDVIPWLADILVEASNRVQLIVTTHSDILIDALSECPESVIVAEKLEAGTTLRRLGKKELAPWLEKYRLGSLWLRGEIGGVRR